ncbi:hypothetical protein EGJ54_15800 [Pandoraea apista]|nr:hypothetical protein EGJ54_15800 [Pandoraea apista]RRX03013.1 hypothetical protein EGJ56_12005 [Pandoraea apista]
MEQLASFVIHSSDMKTRRLDRLAFLRIRIFFVLSDRRPYFSAAQRIPRLRPDCCKYNRCAVSILVCRFFAPDINFAGLESFFPIRLRGGNFFIDVLF